MSRLLASTTLALSLALAPLAAQALTIGDITPTLTFPDPQPDTVTQGAGGIDK